MPVINYVKMITDNKQKVTKKSCVDRIIFIQTNNISQISYANFPFIFLSTVDQRDDELVPDLLSSLDVHTRVSKL